MDNSSVDDAYLTIANSTITNNKQSLQMGTTIGSSIFIVDSSSTATAMQIANTVLWNMPETNSPPASTIVYTDKATVNYNHCAYWDNNDDNIDISNIYKDLFVSASATIGLTEKTDIPDWHPTATSPLKDAGTNGIGGISMPKHDIAEARREVFDAIDIGAYEYIQLSAPRNLTFYT